MSRCFALKYPNSFSKNTEGPKAAATENHATQVQRASPERTVIDSIVKRGAAATDEQSYPQLLRRSRNACFLNDQNQPLLPQERLISQYRKDGLVLFLSAGTSKSSGIPNWPELAGEVLQKSGIERRNRELDKVKKALPSYIAQFELAALRLGSKNFVRTVYEALYAGRKCAALVSLLKKIPLEYSRQSATC